jgi:sister chromatid cohesion protein DCC1
VLCTPTKSFQIRQVQTSNCIFVTQPSLDAHGNAMPTPTTCAIAACTATLELHPADTPAVAYLEDVLPVYDIIGGEVDVTQNGKSKAAVFADIPLSNGQCEQGWVEAVAFELSGSSYRPSANTLRQVWSSINAAALAEGMKLDSQFLGYDLAELVHEEGYPAALAQAVFGHLASTGQDTSGQWSCLDRRKVVSFVGRTLLQAGHRSSGYPIADFVEEWKDSVPEAWRSDADLATIHGAYDNPTSTTIAAKGTSASATAESIAPKATAAKGKWHERFAKTRKK